MNNEEIELKFFVNSDLSADAVVALMDQNLSGYELQKFPRKSLCNVYYDTRSQALRRNHMGMRVRSDGDGFEQTIKTSSNTGGGLHSRREFNVSLDSQEPDPTRFPPEAWEGTDLDPSALGTELREVFTTNFTRIRRNIVSGGRILAEFCFDSGKITAGQSCEFISEIELELADGTLPELLEIARHLIDNEAVSLHLDSRSKAQRGYALARLSVPPAARSFTLLEGPRDVLIRSYFDMFLEHEQILLSRFDLKSLSVMTLSAYQLQKLTNDDGYNMIIPRLLELERMVADSEGRMKKFIRMISSRVYMRFILDSFEKIYCA